MTVPKNQCSIYAARQACKNNNMRRGYACTLLLLHAIGVADGPIPAGPAVARLIFKQ